MKRRNAQTSNKKFATASRHKYVVCFEKIK